MWPLVVDPFSLYNETAGLKSFAVVLSEKSALKCSVQLKDQQCLLSPCL